MSRGNICKICHLRTGAEKNQEDRDGLTEFAMRICDEFNQSFSLSAPISRKTYDETKGKEVKRGDRP
jgi:hypothetical protein